MSEIDFLIVGQGLAGSILAWKLIQKSYNVLIIDNGAENASQIAAGLVNPVTGQRFVKIERVEEYLSTAKSCYAKLGAYFKQSFFVEMPMMRILQNENEQKYANKRLNQSEYQQFLQQNIECDYLTHNQYGTLLQKQTGFLRTKILLSCLTEYFISNGCYRLCQLDYQDIQLEPCASWLDIQPRHIVFCEGYHARNNPWFGNLPFQLAKGQILSCYVSGTCPPAIINYGNWLLPVSSQCFKTGATFETNYLDMAPSQEASLKLLTGTKKYCSQLEEIVVKEHKVGIRPTTLDKQAFIGTHPRFRNLHIFNGFGAKGSLSIPWCAQHFITVLEHKIRLNSQLDISRYFENHVFN